MTLDNVSPDFFNDKMETFLVCRKLASYLRKNTSDEVLGILFEEWALKAIQRAMGTVLELADAQLLLDELPEILTLDYPAVKEIRKTCMQFLPQIIDWFRVNSSGSGWQDMLNIWLEIRGLEFSLEMLRAFDFYEHD